MKGESNPDGWVRLDFAGGWKGDKKNAFSGANLSSDEKDIQTLVKSLGTFRKQSSALKTGKLMQYIPVDGLYVYFRYDANQTIMCVMNTSNKDQSVSLDKYTECTKGFSKGKNIVDGNSINANTFSIPAMKMWVIELEK